MAAGRLDIEYAYKTRPSTLLNNLFMSTVKMASKSLISMASNIQQVQSRVWRPRDHFRFMVMLTTWVTVWFLRVLMDHFPSCVAFSPHYFLGGFSPARPFNLLPAPSSSTALTTCDTLMDLILQEECIDGPSVKALGRSLTHILALMNEIPATSRKYQFAMAMADRIMEGNFREGNLELLEVNRTALSSAFERTLALLHRSLQPQLSNGPGAWTFRIIRSLPMGSYIASYMKGMNHCLRAIVRTVRSSGSLQLVEKRGVPGMEGPDDVVAEKLAQELLWMTHKLRAYGAVDEALVQWSFASGLASLALTANSRVQGLIVKISAILVAELPGHKIEVSRQVKFRTLAIWLPLFCHASNGLSYPVLTNFEKMEVERAIDEVISTLPAMDQEVILTNWLQDFAVTASDWPNLQVSYDRWCQYTRDLVA